MSGSSYLLDTQVVLWMDREPERLSLPVRAALEDASALYFSAASAWEAAIKRETGKLALRTAFTVIARSMQIEELAVTARHGELAGTLPRHHGDPFDRMLVAQALAEKLVLVTGDRTLTKYQGELLLV